MTEQQETRTVGATSGDHGAETGRYSQQHGEQEHGANGSAGQDSAVRVLEPQASDKLRNRWNEVQAGFVDEPRKSVTEADQLVGEVLDEVSKVFRDQRAQLEREWAERDEPGTEDLRLAMQRYREFFDRLLSL